MLLILMNAVRGEAPVFLSAGRELPFWDMLPVLMFRVVAQVTGHDLVFAAVLYALPSALVSPLVRSIALDLRLSPRAALAAGLGAAFYPYYVSTSWYQPEVGITILLASLTTFAFLRLPSSPFRKGAPLAFVSALLLLLDRPDAVVFILWVALVAAWPARRRRRALGVLGFAIVIAFGTIGWVNVRATGRFSPVPGKSGYNLLLGHNSAVNAYLKTNHGTTMEKFVIGAAFAGFPDEIQADKQSAAYSDLYRGRAFAFIRAHPKLTLENTVYKLYRYWDWRLEDADRESVGKNLTYTVSYLVLLLSAFLGTVGLMRSRGGHVLLFAWGGMLALCLPGLVTIPIIRVRMYTEFLLMVLGGVGLDRLFPGKQKLIKSL